MDYGTSYQNVTSLADTIRESVHQSKGPKATGLAAREAERLGRLAPTDEYLATQAQYINNIRKMFEEVKPKEGLSLSVDKGEPMRYAGAGDYEQYQRSYGAYKSDDAERIKGKLVARGMPEHIAEGFVMNFADESGLNPIINEKNPLVKGSRGGFGLYQLTGPRRVAYEEFAERQGIDPSNPIEQEDAQLSFLFTELMGSEKNNWKVIQEADNAGTAAAYVAKYFLRPAEEHLNKRIQKYTGRPTDFTRKPQART